MATAKSYSEGAGMSELQINDNETVDQEQLSRDDITVSGTKKLNVAKKFAKAKKRKGPGLRDVSILENPYRNKWRIIRWSFLLSVNFLFFASFYFDIQILEGSLSGSRLLGFHLADPFAALQMMLASHVFNINLIIGTTTVIIIYLLLGGDSFVRGFVRTIYLLNGEKRCINIYCIIKLSNEIMYLMTGLNISFSHYS